tara:strand:- start:2728 stop:4785 length:2058 start_codon:yes stop_codon:yes gene_type:complete
MASKTLDPIDILLELGIDLDDLSEQDYLSALMEAIATIEFQTKGKGDERSAVLREEVIKIRKGKRKPQAKRTKISANSLKSTPRLAAKTAKISPQKLLPGSEEVGKEEPEQDSIIKILTDISESVKSILYSLKASNNISKNLAEDERKRQESKKRSGAESKLEKKRFEGLKKLGGKLIQPIKGPLDALFNFLKNVILGRIVIGIIDWLGDPENQKKLESLIRFFKDWWPTIVTAVLLFGTGLGGLLKSIVGITFKFIPKLLGLLPGLLKFLKSPMGRIAGLAVAGAGLAGRLMDGGEDDVDLTKGDAPAQTTPATQTTPAAPAAQTTPAASAQTETPAPVQTEAPTPQMGGKTPYERATEAGYEVLNAADGLIIYQKDGQTRTKTGTFRVQGATTEERFNDYFSTPRDKFLRREGERGFDPATAKVPTLKLKGGGQVPGSGPNKDTVPAMLAPGEFVMSRGAVQKYGSSTLASMNAAGGGTNLPERVNGITYAAGGGMVSGYEKEKSSSRHKQLMNERTIPGMSGGGGGTNALTNQAKSKTFGGIIRDVFNTFRKKQIDPQTVLGEVKESSGIDVPGATADRQRIDAQPGEYILPVDTVNYLGGPAKLDLLVAQTDSNSTPAKLGARSKKISQVGPPMPMQPQINLIPTPTGSSKGYGDSSGSALPNFDAGIGDPNKAKLLGVVR